MSDSEENEQSVNNAPNAKPVDAVAQAIRYLEEEGNLNLKNLSALFTTVPRFVELKDKVDLSDQGKVRISKRITRFKAKSKKDARPRPLASAATTKSAPVLRLPHGQGDPPSAAAPMLQLQLDSNEERKADYPMGIIREMQLGEIDQDVSEALQPGIAADSDIVNQQIMPVIIQDRTPVFGQQLAFHLMETNNSRMQVQAQVATHSIELQPEQLPSGDSQLPTTSMQILPLDSPPTQEEVALAKAADYCRLMCENPLVKEQVGIIDRLNRENLNLKEQVLKLPASIIEPMGGPSQLEGEIARLKESAQQQVLLFERERVEMNSARTEEQRQREIAEQALKLEIDALKQKIEQDNASRTILTEQIAKLKESLKKTVMIALIQKKELQRINDQQQSLAPPMGSGIVVQGQAPPGTMPANLFRPMELTPTRKIGALDRTGSHESAFSDVAVRSPQPTIQTVVQTSPPTAMTSQSLSTPVLPMRLTMPMGAPTLQAASAQATGTTTDSTQSRGLRPSPLTMALISAASYIEQSPPSPIIPREDFPSDAERQAQILINKESMAYLNSTTRKESEVPKINNGTLEEPNYSMEMCQICYKQFKTVEEEGPTARRNAIKLHCSHCFHVGCLYQWFKTQGGDAILTCPNCRNVISKGIQAAKADQEVIDNYLASWPKDGNQEEEKVPLPQQPMVSGKGVLSKGKPVDQTMTRSQVSAPLPQHNNANAKAPTQVAGRSLSDSTQKGQDSPIITLNEDEFAEYYFKTKGVHRQEWMKLLEFKERLCDTSIDKYRNLLQQQYNAHGTAHVVFLTPLLYRMQDQDDIERHVIPMLKKQDSSFNFQHVLMPCNFNKDHWRLALINLEDLTIHIIDSISYSKQENDADFKGLLQHVVPAVLKARMMAKDLPQSFKAVKLSDKITDHGKLVKVLTKDFKLDVVKGIPKQSNDYDCGICTCINMEILARTGRIEEIKYKSDNSALAQARYLVRQELLLDKTILTNRHLAMRTLKRAWSESESSVNQRQDEALVTPGCTQGGPSATPMGETPGKRRRRQ